MDKEQDTRKYTRLAGVWTNPKDGTEWLVDFYLTELDGKFECVGMTVRSFVLPAERGTEKHPNYQWGALPAESMDLTQVWGEAADMHRRGGEITPTPLRTAVLRADLLGKMLPTMVAEVSKDMNALADRYESLAVPFAAEATRGRRIAQEPMEPSTSRGGRPRKYTREDLERAAEVFKLAQFTSPAPYKIVAQELGLKNRGVAGKLILECRKQGLLPWNPRPKKAIPGKPGEKPTADEQEAR